ncbi:hypothetical protein TWF481_006977 [Arthrobotrys musiformis]|uniref:Uncharacterized protein n=1 Tax=Arthrobotrys musiformis TaxID=47236 RepID=A0AAV9WBQ9_9PEZI
MRYAGSVLPVCAVLAYLAGTTLALPVLDDCFNDDTTGLVKRDAEAHVSIPHVVANFQPEPSGSPSPSPSSEGGEEAHKLQKRADRWASVKKTFGRITNKLCGTGEARREAAENSMLRQSNAGISQQDIIAPEGFDENILPPVIDLGENNQDQNQGQNQGQVQNQQGPVNEVIVEEDEEDFVDIDSPPENRRRRPSIRPQSRKNVGRFGTEQDIKDMVSRLPKYPAPVRIQDTELFQERTRNLESIPEQLGESASSLPRGSIQLGQSGDLLPQGSVQSGQGSGESGTEVGDPNDLRISLSESLRNPFIPGAEAREFYRQENLWPADELDFSDEEADVEVPGRNGMNAPPQNNQGDDQMRTGKLPKFLKKVALDYGVPYAAKELLGVDISPIVENEGVLDYLRGRRGKNVVVVDPNQQEKKPNFFQRLIKGRYKEPVKVLNTGPAETRPGYTGEINVQPNWVVNPGEVLSKAARDREEADRREAAALGIDVPTLERQRAQRQKVEKIQLDKSERDRRAELYDQLFPEGDDGEVYIPNEEPNNGNNNLVESLDMLETAQIFTEDLTQPQIRQNVLGQPQVINLSNPQQPNSMNQAQVGQGQMGQAQVVGGQMNQPKIQFPEGGIDIQLGSPARSNVAVQDVVEDYVSFGEGNESAFGEDTAHFAGNLKESAQSQGWNLGVSQISAFPQLQVQAGGNGGVEYPPYIEGESRDEEEYADLAEYSSPGLAPEQIQTEVVDEQISEIQGGDEGSVQTLQSSVATIADPNFSFANANLGGSLSGSLSSGGSQGSQVQGQPLQ